MLLATHDGMVVWISKVVTGTVVFDDVCTALVVTVLEVVFWNEVGLLVVATVVTLIGVVAGIVVGIVVTLFNVVV